MGFPSIPYRGMRSQSPESSESSRTFTQNPSAGNSTEKLMETVPFDPPASSTRSRSRSRRWLDILLVTLPTILIILLVADIGIQLTALRRPVLETSLAPYHKPDQKASSASACYCGKTVAEAKSLGCKFESLSFCWLPEHCRDDELIERFDKESPPGGWVYWRDAEFQHPVSIEEIAESAGTGIKYRVNRDWHKVHCMYYWWKFFRLDRRGRAERGYVMEDFNRDETHIAHCLDNVRNPYQIWSVPMLGGAAEKEQHFNGKVIHFDEDIDRWLNVSDVMADPKLSYHPEVEMKYPEPGARMG